MSMHYWGASSRPQLQTVDCAKSITHPRNLSLEEEFLLLLSGCNEDFARVILLVSMDCQHLVFLLFSIRRYAFHQRDLYRMPSREVTTATMPACFAKFPSTRIVIDCTEVFSH